MDQLGHTGGDPVPGKNLPGAVDTPDNCRVKVDDRGRLKLPVDVHEWLKALGIKRVYITSGDAKTIQVYPYATWQVNQNRMEQAGTPAARNTLYRMKHYGASLEIDDSARLLLKTELREKLALESVYVYLECRSDGRINIVTEAVHSERLGTGNPEQDFMDLEAQRILQ
jgi:DNA-binding transcriptional regulator/RsmH inhibitor MraZ